MFCGEYKLNWNVLSIDDSQVLLYFLFISNIKNSIRYIYNGAFVYYNELVNLMFKFLFVNINHTTKWLLFFFHYLFIFILLYNTVLVLPYIDMNPPRVYMSPQSWIPLPPLSPYHLSGSSQCTSPKHPVSCIEPRLAIRFFKWLLFYLKFCHRNFSMHTLTFCLLFIVEHMKTLIHHCEQTSLIGPL